MVHFPGFARARLWIQRAVRRFCRRGFPHSEIPGSKPACGSPRLIAACHVLHRLLLPRHPPCALSSLTIKFTQRFLLFLGLRGKPLRPRDRLERDSSRRSLTRSLEENPGNFKALAARSSQYAEAYAPAGVKALIKNYSALYLPNRFSCQTSSVATCAATAA